MFTVRRLLLVFACVAVVTAVVAPAALIWARSFPLVPRSSPASVMSVASVRYAAVGPSVVVSLPRTINRIGTH